MKTSGYQEFILCNIMSLRHPELHEVLSQQSRRKQSQQKQLSEPMINFRVQSQLSRTLKEFSTSQVLLSRNVLKEQCYTVISEEFVLLIIQQVLYLIFPHEIIKSVQNMRRNPMNDFRK